MYAILNSPIILSIIFYRKFLSPRKKYKCAYSVAGHGDTCSGYGLFVFNKHSPVAAIALLRIRFKECRDASRRIAKQRGRVDAAQMCCTFGPMAAAGCCSGGDSKENKDQPYGGDGNWH